MRISLTAVDATTGERVDVLLDLEPTDPVSALEPALARLLTSPSPGLWLGALHLDPTRTVTAVGVRSGCVLALGGPLLSNGLDLRHGTGGTGGADLHVVSGTDAGAVHPLPTGDVVVGRGAQISLDDADVAPAHLGLHVSQAGVVATDLGAAPAVRLAGRPLDGPTALGAADLLEVGGDLVAVVPRSQQRAAVNATAELALEVNRPPRLRPARVVSTIALPTPPAAPETQRLAVFPLVLPVLLGGVMALVASPLFLLFTLMSPVLALSSWASGRRTGRRSGRRAQQAYAEDLATAEGQIALLMAAETADRRAACPDPAALLLTATGPGRRLWERRRGDDDSLLLRVGTGPAEAGTIQVTGPPTRPRPGRPVLQDVPVTVALRDLGVLGLAGPPATTRALARGLVGQAAVLHSPRDLSVLLLVDLGSPAPESDWGWLRWLPHAAPTGEGCAAMVGTTVDSLTARVAELGALVAGRAAAALDVRSQLRTRRQPDVLVVLDGARGLRGLPGMAAVLRDGPAVGVHLVCLDEHERLLPGECQAVVLCEGGASVTVARDGGAPQQTRGDLVSVAWAEQVARALSPLRVAGRDEDHGELPASARLLEVLSLDPPTGDAVRARWSLGGRTTTAVVGLDLDGPFALDLSHDGPHALVAGTTGAGKSEFLQTLVASLAAANRPDAMTFVLVDYKGGAAFKDCARLPHTVGMVTDLDRHLVERALASLSAELKTREQLLGQVGAKDLEDYWRAGAAAGPLARLVIVIDEFASLVEELPEFVRGLVGIAQRGRSLGVHLVLATQRPGGVVSPEIRANTNLRVALRVTDASESLDVVDAPDAATVAQSTPGRGYARTGHASLTAFQSARVGGRAPGAVASGPASVEARRLPWDRVGLPLPRPTVVPAGRDDDQTDLHALVEAVRDAAASLGLAAPRSPWLEALPPTVSLDAVQAVAGSQAAPFRPAEAAGSSAVTTGTWPLPLPLPLPSALPAVAYGLEDLPDQQSRRAAGLDLEHGGHLLVAGAPRAGRSTFLRTLAVSLATTVSPADAHLYALDCGNSALLPLAALPHCGAVVTRNQVERADRLLARLGAEVARRQQLLALHGYADVAEQRAAGAEPLPYLVLLVDRWEGFVGAFEDVDAGRMTDAFLRLLREGPGVGLRVVVTGDRSALIGKVASAVEDVLVLRLADRSDYALAGLSPRLLPETVVAGRGFLSGSGTEVQVALLGEDASGPGQSAALSTVVAAWEGRAVDGPRPFRVDVLPARLALTDIPLSCSDPGPASRPGNGLWALIGVGGDELAAQGVDLALSGPGFVIAGPAGSGRSTALMGVATSLLGAGTPVCVLAPRRSPLRGLDGQPGVVTVLTSTDPDPAQVAAALNQTAGRLAVLVDDAELLHHSPVSDLLQQVLHGGRDQDHCLVAAGTTDDLGTTLRGFTAEARKSRSGLLLSPSTHLQGELLGVRLPRSAVFDGPPGRGLLVRSGQALLVQVAAP